MHNIWYRATDDSMLISHDVFLPQVQNGTILPDQSYMIGRGHATKSYHTSV